MHCITSYNVPKLNEFDIEAQLPGALQPNIFVLQILSHPLQVNRLSQQLLF